MQREKVIEVLKKALKTLVVFGVAIGLTYFLEKYDIQTENLLLVYMLAVVVIILETRSRVFGVLSSLLFALCFDFLFIEPKYRFTLNSNYYPTIAVFMLVAILVSFMAHRMHRQSLIAKKRERTTKKLYKISKGMLNITGIEELLAYGEETLSDVADCNVKILYGEDEVFKNPFAKWCFQNSSPCGAGEDEFPAEKNRYVPIRYNKKTVGVVIFDCNKKSIDEDTWNIVGAVISQISLTIERDIMSSHEEETKLKARQDRIKTNLLQSVAHDLQKPLSDISIGSAKLQKNGDNMSKEEFDSIIERINSSTDWLCNTVENLFNMTKLQSDASLEINKSLVSVTDIINTVAQGVASRVYSHNFVTLPPAEDFFINADKQLLCQALTNAVDNAFRHTRSDCDVVLKVEKKDKKAVFRVDDNGGGIDEDKIDLIFENYYSVEENVGIGLSVCKYIVEEHGGAVNIFNNHNGGATFKMTLPTE